MCCVLNSCNFACKPGTAAKNTCENACSGNFSTSKRQLAIAFANKGNCYSSAFECWTCGTWVSHCRSSPKVWRVVSGGWRRHNCDQTNFHNPCSEIVFRSFRATPTEANGNPQAQTRARQDHPMSTQRTASTVIWPEAHTRSRLQSNNPGKPTLLSVLTFYVFTGQNFHHAFHFLQCFCLFLQLFLFCKCTWLSICCCRKFQHDDAFFVYEHGTAIKLHGLRNRYLL